MTRFQMISRTSLMAGLLGGTAAYADVTAQNVWDNWKEQLDMYGSEGVSIGSETMEGDTLVVESLSMSMTDGDEGVSAEMGPITFTEMGDGTVKVGFPESYPMVINVEGMEIAITVSNENLEILASGDPDAVSYDMTADSYSMTLDSLGDEFDAEGILNAGTLVMSDISGTYVVRTENMQTMDYSLNIGAIDIDFDIREKGGSGVVTFNGDMADMIAAAKIAIPPEMDLTSDEPDFVEGFLIEGGYTVGASTYAFDFSADGEAANGQMEVGSIGLQAKFDYNGVRYETESNDISIQAMFPNELPFPIEASLAEYGVTLDVPLSQSDDPREVAMAFTLRDLEVSDGLWNIFDPGTILPRDPATIVIDISGKVTPFFDFLDPDQQEAIAMSDVPGELNELSLNALTVRAAGAEILGQGDFTFDNSDLETFDGLPRPQGEVNLEINGINGLIDKLVQMGLIPEEEAMMPRMMMGMFATPVGDDQLTSKIEINSEGHVLANGQRLQ